MKTVLFLCGGRSEEHEISLISAQCILDALDRSKFKPLVVGIAKSGVWHLANEKTFYEGEFRADKIRLNEKNPRVSLQPFSEDRKGVLWADGKRHEFDLVFPILHGQYGEDGTIQGLFDFLGVPYVGSHCESSAICMDKEKSKIICGHAGVRVVDYVCVRTTEELKTKAAAVSALKYPMFVKPARQGSSVGVSKVKDPLELNAAVEKALQHDSKALIEKSIVGREFECAVLGSTFKARTSGVGEIIPSPSIGWYSYEGKYLLPDGAETVASAQMEPALLSEIQKTALKTYEALECEGMARVDFFWEKATGLLYLNEVNTIPGFTPISMYPKMWGASGLNYSELITQLLTLAHTRAL